MMVVVVVVLVADSSRTNKTGSSKTELRTIFPLDI